LRNHILNLYTELSDKGIYAGYIGIGVWMQEGSDVQDKIADIWYDMYTKRDRAEEYISEDKIKSDLWLDKIIFLFFCNFVVF